MGRGFDDAVATGRLSTCNTIFSAGFRFGGGVVFFFADIISSWVAALGTWLSTAQAWRCGRRERVCCSSAYFFTGGGAGVRVSLGFGRELSPTSIGCFISYSLAFDVHPGSFTPASRQSRSISG